MTLSDSSRAIPPRRLPPVARGGAPAPRRPVAASELAVSRAPWQPRSELDLLGQQLAGIERFNRARHARESAAAASARTREMRLDASRSMHVLRRQHDALIARAHEQLRASGDLLHGTAECRVVLAHRSEWFLREVSTVLSTGGVSVVAELDNGADVVGLVVAEQPDLVLVEDALAMVRGEDVLREAREFAGDTLVGVQVASDDRMGPLLDAGAAAVFSRRTRPREVAGSLLGLLAVG